MELHKGGNAPLWERLITVTLSWRGVMEVDASALLLSVDRNVRSNADFVHGNNPRHQSGAVTHVGARVVGDSCDSIAVDLGLIEPGVERIMFVASAGGVAMGSLQDMHVVVHSSTTEQELLSFQFAPTVETAIVAGEIYLRGDNWKFRAIGQGYDSGLQGIAAHVGLTNVEGEISGRSRPQTNGQAGVLSNTPDQEDEVVPVIVQNFTDNIAHESVVRAMLVAPEQLIAIVESEQRIISVTSGRIILHERSGGYSVIRNCQISSIEISDRPGGTGMFIAIHFGGGLSRTVAVADATQAAVIVSASARG